MKTASTSAILETLKYVQKFCGSGILIKIGGAALEDMQIVTRLCEDLALIRSCGISLILVHGGGKSINYELEKHGIKWSFHEGQRITTPEMMGIIEMVLGGKSNKTLVRTLNSAGIAAVGLSGSDGDMIRCSQETPELGLVGKIETIDTTILQNYLNSQKESGKGYIPVVAPMGVGNDGQPYNVNADWAAAGIAQALGIKKLIYLTDQDGILDENEKLITRFSYDELEKLKGTSAVSGGMLAKINTILFALNGGIEAVHVINGTTPHSVINELFTTSGTGTICRG